jgi:thiamine phosphate synthase YjbQ (UPF0047 family)
MAHQDRIYVKIAGHRDMHRDMHDITAQVANVVARSKVRIGTAHVFNVGSTACVGMIEYGPGLEAQQGEYLR